MTTAWKHQRTERFRILHRDNFTCRYCGDRPGGGLLEVDHLIPRNRGGSDHASNLVAACKTCNGRKSDTIFFPHDCIERADEEQGWWVHKTFGDWSVVFCDTVIGVEKQRYGFIDGWRLFDRELISHLHSKPWSALVLADMDEAFQYLRRMLRHPRELGGQDG